MSRNTRIVGAIVAVLVLGGCTTATSTPPATTVPSLSATASPSTAAAPAATDIVLFPKSPLATPTGAAVPGDLIGRRYAQNPPEILDGRQLVLTLRAADDPHCMAMYEGRSTCFTVLWSPVKPNDPAARGSARVVDGKLVLELALVPSDTQCVGEAATYAYEDGGQTLRGIVTPMPCTFPGFRELGATSTSSSSYAFDTRTIADEFALEMKLTVPSGWKHLGGIVGGLGLVHAGYPEGPDSTWWGPDILLVENAQIHDPSDVVSSEPAKADKARFIAWPADFFAYITALSGVTVVSGPEPITIGGVTGTQIVVMTPAMHPLVWLKGDHSWLGGGPNGVDQAQERRFIELKKGGHTLFVTLGWDPSTFEAKDAELRAILDSITFE
jgi:hypothetical protein